MSKVRKVKTAAEVRQYKTDKYNLVKSKYKTILEILENDVSSICSNEKAKIEETFRLLREFNVTPNTISKILSHIKVNKNMADVTRYLLSNIFVSPFNFLTIEVALLRFRKCIQIKEARKLTVHPSVEVRGWLSDCFIKEFNKFYEELENVNTRYKQIFALPTSYLTENLRTIYLHRLTNEIVEKTDFNAVPYVTTDYFVRFEKQLGDDILDIFYDDEPADIDMEALTTFISSNETPEFKYDYEQKEAIQKALQYRASIINGAPGTGKSTIVKMINNFKQNVNVSNKLHIYNLGPTGLAAKNLQKCGTAGAGVCSTFHAFINKMRTIQYNKDPDFYNAHIHINADECSMVNMLLLRDLISTILTTRSMFKAKFTMTFIGDTSQLPPIGIGYPFKCMIDSDLFPITMLTKINRSVESISEKITKMNMDKRLARNDFVNNTFRFIDTADFRYQNIKSILDSLGFNPMDTHVLIPQHDKEPLCDTSTHEKLMKLPIQGIESTNYLLQRIWNNSKDGYTFINSQMVAVGDRVVRIVNDYKDEQISRVNGDSGIISYINTANNTVVIKYYDDNTKDEVVTYDEFSELFQLFYASSVHKMQGSQKTNIVIIVHPSHRWDKKLIYTAISRAQSNCIIIGNFNKFFRAQEEKSPKQFTYFMREFINYEL